MKCKFCMSSLCRSQWIAQPKTLCPLVYLFCIIDWRKTYQHLWNHQFISEWAFLSLDLGLPFIVILVVRHEWKWRECELGGARNKEEATAMAQSDWRNTANMPWKTLLFLKPFKTFLLQLYLLKSPPGQDFELAIETIMSCDIMKQRGHLIGLRGFRDHPFAC